MPIQPARWLQTTLFFGKLFLAADRGAVRRVGGVAFGLGLPARRKVPARNSVPGDGPPVAGRTVRLGFHGDDFISLVRVGIGHRMLKRNAFRIVDGKPLLRRAGGRKLDRLAGPRS
jgi:hypothetical protein